MFKKHTAYNCIVCFIINAITRSGADQNSELKKKENYMYMHGFSGFFLPQQTNNI